ncbi:general transcription factor 3C polypeptide 6 isoform X2 [Rhineura floridana]|uniref:general transcription factor 3C polypeptide 6 isoform X2 n=1 Tax=Rhineura floridana TaxID=261503 RepID=UPI002AC82584|nr:general transcription factor 3C polypeptide 6 isoform X2 [Rhineura floridana]
METVETPCEGGEADVEEQLVMVELSGIIDSDFLEKCENKCKILGIDTERPILQVDRYVFAGEYEDTLGTCLVFEENKDHGGGVEWLELKDKDFSYSRPNMICNFLHEKEEEAAESQDKLAEESEGEASDKGNSDQAFETEMQPNIGTDDCVPLLNATYSEAVDSSLVDSQVIARDDSPH